MKKALFCALILSATTAAAQDASLSSSYAFGGACSSQGLWTQNALSATQNLRKITLQLRDDPNCQALGKTMETAFGNLEQQLQNANVGQSSETRRRLQDLPREIGALRNYVSAPGADRSQIMQLMMNRAVEGASLSAQVGGNTPNEASANLMKDLGQRFQESSKTGLKVFNQVVDTLPQLDQCLMGDGQQAVGNLVAGLVQVASSFASSGNDTTGGNMALTVSKISSYMRNSKFSATLRKLNQQEFLASMACLIELTSESYCSARDATSLFKKGMSDLSWKQELNGKITSQNPFIGYYVLNTHVPNITKWLQKIQIGVDPMLPTDAVFQNRILQEVTDFYKGLKTLLGDYNSALLTIKTLPNTEAKQNAVLKLIGNITDSMAPRGSNPDKTNFFTISKTEIKIPFFLIGMDVPDQVLGREQGLMKISYDDWLQANISTLPQFQDPELLAETIGKNMQELAAAANASVIEYFSKWYIVDKSALVVESMVDINYTVQDSLLITQKYLEVAKDRVQKYGGNPAIITQIFDTQSRIDKILNQYKIVQEKGRAYSRKAELERKAQAEKIAAAERDPKKRKPVEFIPLSETEMMEISFDSVELIETVYEQFMVMQARSGFLANRMITIVRNDYNLLIENKVNFDDYQREIFIATGMAGLDRMLQMFNGNPANIQTDLNMALSINKGNLEALEYLMKDNLIAMLAEKKMVEEDRNGGWLSTWIDSNRRLLKDTFTDKYAHFNGWNLAPDLTSPVGAFSVLGYWWAHSDRYPMKSNASYAPQSEFSEASAIKAQLCLQSLAFWNRGLLNNGPLFDLCTKSILFSPFDQAKVNMKGLDMSYNERLNSHVGEKNTTVAMQKALNHSARICAFRDFNRKNLVQFLSLNKKDKQQFVFDAKQANQPAAQ